MYDLTDHLPNFLIINKFSTLPKNFKISRRDYSQFSESSLLEDFQSVNWNQVIPDSNNATLMFDAFYSKLSKIVDKHIPLKQLSKKDIKHISKPWITPGIRASLIVKNKIYNKFIKTRSLYYQNKFKLYRNKLNHLIRISKIDYYNKYFNSNRTHLKNIWRGIKQIIS